MSRRINISHNNAPYRFSPDDTEMVATGVLSTLYSLYQSGTIQVSFERRASEAKSFLNQATREFINSHFQGVLRLYFLHIYLKEGQSFVLPASYSREDVGVAQFLIDKELERLKEVYTPDSKPVVLSVLNQMHEEGEFLEYNFDLFCGYVSARRSRLRGSAKTK